MLTGKKVTLEGQNFLIGVPSGDDTWNTYLSYLSAAPQFKIGTGTICKEKDSVGRCAIRGDQYSAKTWWHSNCDVICRDYGFRPVLYPHYQNFEEDPLLLGVVPSGTVLRAYSLWMGDTPVRTDSDEPQKYDPSKPLRFSEEYVGDEYLIPWVVVEGCAISARVLLTYISWQDLSRQGFVE